jgi:hypothetical protein
VCCYKRGKNDRITIGLGLQFENDVIAHLLLYPINHVVKFYVLLKTFKSQVADFILPLGVKF